MAMQELLSLGQRGELLFKPVDPFYQRLVCLK